mmetsp:Transcript_20505/g.26083  ORF Transcript_20505/g.26083 Transcript_20505/m.26083 type:complete len:282 (-) Transcript_20505:35-880(-)
MHLAGTNKYNVPETIFDDIRMKQLQTINDACFNNTEMTMIGAVVDDASSFRKLRPIVLGDLNFRVEVFSSEGEKERGGKDFCAVNEILMEGETDKVRQLFLEYDRLCLHLGHTTRQQQQRGKNKFIMNDVNENENHKTKNGSTINLDDKSFPSLRRIDLLSDVVDLIWRESFQNKQKTSSNVILPTFTFKVGDVPPRSYANKRTPSWTDRILVSQRLLLLLLSESDDNWICCDKDQETMHSEEEGIQQPLLVGSGEVTSIGTNDDIVLSDHIPLHCLIHFK